MLFVGSSVWDWWERYCYLEKFPHTAPPFDKEDPRFLAFKRNYLAQERAFREKVSSTGTHEG